MLINAQINSEKDALLIEQYVSLINKGVSPDEILFLCSNPIKKERFLHILAQKPQLTAIKHNLYTFYGLAYNKLNEHYNGEINLVGLELSQYFLKKAIKETGFAGYNSKISLLHQLFRRYSLIVQNSLSNDEIHERSKVLNEAYGDDAKDAIDNFIALTNKYKAYDYLRQLDLFTELSQKSNLFPKLKHLIVENADEMTFQQLDFIKTIAPQLDTYTIQYDEKGCSRLGFQSADKNAPKFLQEIFSTPPNKLESNSRTKSDAQKLFDSIIENKPTILSTFEHKQYTRRLEMIEQVCDDIKSLLAKGISPSEISIIAPGFDNILKSTLSRELSSTNAPFQILSGSEKLVDNCLVAGCITYLKCTLDVDLTDSELKTLFTHFLQIPIKYIVPILENYKNQNQFCDIEFKNEKYKNTYANFKTQLKKDIQSDTKISQKAEEAFKIAKQQPFFDYKNLETFDFFIKQIKSFEKIFSDKQNDRTFQQGVLTQIENSIVSENPTQSPKIQQNHIIIGTVQKIIDYEIVSKYQFWLDTSSNDWLKDDIGPLYNSWVFQKAWIKPFFDYEDNIKCKQEKAARQLRKLTLCASEKITTYSSTYDNYGIENIGGIEKYFSTTDNKIEISQNKKFIPRTDQQKVLEYTKNRLAIAAVPGAGKTTVLLALTAQLIAKGTKPEKIFVLTYMDSAAKNFKERLRTMFRSNIQMPNISTIHGLALRILKENDNFLRLNLAQDFDVIDDIEKEKITKELLARMQIEPDLQDNFERSISAVKFSKLGLPENIKHEDIKKFADFFNNYNKILAAKNLIDYDDMVVFAVKLLRENSDILEYYQNFCEYIIEDEAQDSSQLQQSLLELLSGKYKNLIRCGDVNQAITSTFTSADVGAFKEFIQKTPKVEMTTQQRCAKKVYETANSLIEFTSKNKLHSNAFYSLKMKPVSEEKTQLGTVSLSKFETLAEERTFLVQQLRTISQNTPNETSAILLRNNYQVADYSEFLTNQGFSVIAKGDCLSQKPIYIAVYEILRAINAPYNNEQASSVLEKLCKIGLYKSTVKDINAIKELNTPFILANEQVLQSQQLRQFQFDLNYWLTKSHLAPDILTQEIGLYYFKSNIDKSNVYLISILVKRLLNTYNNSPQFLERLQTIASKPLATKLFELNDNIDQSNQQGKVQIMTYYKAKGLEFDNVFLPELNTDNLPIIPSELKLRLGSLFIENINALTQNQQPRTIDTIKKLHIEENLRLFYVAITRAKKSLTISVANQHKKFGRLQKATPSTLTTDFLPKHIK